MATSWTGPTFEGRAHGLTVGPARWDGAVGADFVALRSRGGLA